MNSWNSEKYKFALSFRESGITFNRSINSLKNFLDLSREENETFVPNSKKEEIREAIKKGNFHYRKNPPRNWGIKNMGKKTYLEICKWCEIEPKN
jgi:hypothetical protein